MRKKKHQTFGFNKKKKKNNSEIKLVFLLKLFDKVLIDSI